MSPSSLFKYIYDASDVIESFIDDEVRTWLWEAVGKTF